MVMIDPGQNPKAYWEFEGEIVVLHHPTTISTRYQAMGMALTLRCLRLKFIFVRFIIP